MFKPGFPALILILLLFSCSGPKERTLKTELPADSIIPRGEMIRLMVDLHIVEATLQLQRNRGKDVPELSEGYYQWLYSRYHVSRERFRANLDYYKQDPELFGKMYEEVLKELIGRTQQYPVPGK